MESLYGGWWSATCELDASGQVHAASMTRLEVDPALTRLGLVPELSTEDLVLIRYKSDVLAFSSLITIKSWEASERRATQRRLPFLFNLANPSNGTMVTCDFRFGRWEKNWMPFEFENRLLAVRWFNPHSIIEVGRSALVGRQKMLLHFDPSLSKSFGASDGISVVCCRFSRSKENARYFTRHHTRLLRASKYMVAPLLSALMVHTTYH